MKLPSRLSFLLLALLPWSVFAANSTPPVAGEDYIEIDGGQPFAPLDGKVEVVEVFGYTCPHCAHFEPQLQAWSAKQPSYVRVTPLPGVFGGTWDAFARAYYAADVLGVAKRSHLAMFQAIHDQHSMPAQNVSPQELATFYTAYGVQPQRFIDTLKSPQVEAKVKAARDFAVRSQIPGTPAVIVNGRYLVRARTFEQVLSVTDYLIARERTPAGTAR